MKNNLASVIENVRKNAYNQGHKDAISKMIDLSAMAMCIAMNEALGIGRERFAECFKVYMSIFNDDIVDDYELARIRLERRFKDITGQTIYETIKHV